jgi:hypothetical protein
MLTSGETTRAHASSAALLARYRLLALTAAPLTRVQIHTRALLTPPRVSLPPPIPAVRRHLCSPAAV